MNSITTQVAVKNITDADITEVSDGYAAAEYQIDLHVGDHVITLDCWAHVGWLVPGANADLDGSGLALWGSSQPGGWSVCDGDGQTSGRPTCDGTSGDECDPLTVGTDQFTAEITPDMVPEWADAVAALATLEDSDDDSDEIADAIDVARSDVLAIRSAVANAIGEALDDYSVDVPEPDAADVYDYLDPIDAIPDASVRFGNYRGCGPVVAWIDADGDHCIDFHPSGDLPRSLRDAVCAAAVALVTDAITPGDEQDD